MWGASGNRTLYGFAAVALLLGGCDAHMEVTAIGPRRPALAADCPIRMFPGTPSYQYKPVANVKCEFVNGGWGCIMKLRELACRYGADTIFGESEELASVPVKTTSFAGETTRVITTVTYRATLAVRL